MDRDTTRVRDPFSPISTDLSSIVALFCEFERYFGREVSGVLAFTLGKALGERLYKLYRKAPGKRGLNAANLFLVKSFKDTKLAKDAAAFLSEAENGEVEIFFRVASSAQVWGGGSRPYLYIIRGVLFRFYSLLAPTKLVRIRSRDLSDMVRDCYEYVVRISGRYPGFRRAGSGGGGDEQG